MGKIAKKLTLIGILASVMALASSAAASAHVVVSPNQVLTSERATFAVSVPNEHDTEVTAVRLIIPEGLTSVRPFAKPGWDIEIKKSGEGENASASEIIWNSAGANVPVDMKDEFLFGAKAPDNKTELKWKAYETYADGRVVSWDQDPSDSEDNKPFSITKVVSESTQDSALKISEQAAADAKAAANRALYFGIAGIVVGLAGIFLATRKSKQP